MSQFTEITQVSLSARLKNAFKGIGLGISFVGIALYFLFWNEGNAVRTARALDEGAGQVVSLDSATLDPTFEARLVHISGPVKLKEALVDAALGVEAPAQTVRLERIVEQFAWIEETQTRTDTKLGGGQDKTTTYTYRMDWTEPPASGAAFRVSEGHMNPPMPIRSKILRQQDATVGAYRVSEEISDLGGATPVILTETQAAEIAQALPLSQPAKLVAGQVVFGETVARPALGDIRLRYQAARIDSASVIGLQHGNALVPYTAQNGRKIHLLTEGIKTAEEMFETAQRTNTAKTWMLRIGLLVLLFLGFKALFGVVDVLASILPGLAWISSSVTSLISVALAFCLGGLTMATAWFYYRPIVSLALIAVALAVGLVGALWLRSSAKHAPHPPGTT